MKSLRYPDLICLGAQKAATTWLYDVLRNRDEIFLPPIKEIHYFSQIYNNDARSYGPIHRAAQAESVLNYFQGSGASDPRRPSLVDEVNHLALPDVDDSWYAQIFSNASSDAVCAEICPSYMNMPQAAVQHVLRLNPSVRLLVLIRDPVDRCWSQIRMHISRGIEDRELDSLVSGETSLWPYLFYTDYAGALRRWQRYSSDGQLKLMLHEAIESDPNAALVEIYNFVGLPLPEPDPRLNREVFKGEAIEMPKSLRSLLLRELAPQYAFLETIFPGAVKSWLEGHHALLS